MHYNNFKHFKNNNYYFKTSTKQNTIVKHCITYRKFNNTIKIHKNLISSQLFYETPSLHIITFQQYTLHRYKHYTHTNSNGSI